MMLEQLHISIEKSKPLPITHNGHTIIWSKAYMP